MGTRRGLGVVLDREDGESRVPHPLDGPIVQVHVRQFHLPTRDRVDVDGKAVVLGGDLDLPGVKLLDRMVRPMMAELELVRPTAQGETQNLMPETDPEDRSSSDEPPRGLNQVRHSLRVAGTVAEKDAVWIIGQDLVSGGEGRDDEDIATSAHQLSKDVVLDPAVDGHHLVARLRTED